MQPSRRGPRPRRLDIGEAVRKAREAHGLSREALAFQCSGSGTFISYATILRLELYGRVPDAQVLARIAKQLDLSLDDLLTEPQEDQ